MTKIIVIATYFGTWPAWLPAFLLSCSRNQTIEWLFFTDCGIPAVTYPNIRFEEMDIDQLNALASRKLGMTIQKKSFSQVDLQPAYGLIFDDYVKGFDFWGHCDIDVIWGDIRNFITEEILHTYQIVTCRKAFLAGHFTLWRNDPMINTLFQSAPNYREIFSDPEVHGFDEEPMSAVLKHKMARANPGENTLHVYWPELMVVGLRELETHPDGWYWRDGKIFDAHHRERVYIHFKNWKRTMTDIDFQLGDQPVQFQITQHGIRSKRGVLQWLFPKRPYQQSGLGDLTEMISNISRRSIYYLRFLRTMLLVRDRYWVRQVLNHSISPRDVMYERETGDLFLQDLTIPLKKNRDSFILQSYYSALQLVDQRQARLYRTERDDLVIEVAGLKALIQSAEDLLVLNELLAQGKYNMQFVHPTVVWDVGTHAGLSSLYFANQHEVVVVGCEPSVHQYNQALNNLSFNPEIAHKIKLLNVGISGLKRKPSAYSPLGNKWQLDLATSPTDYGEKISLLQEESEMEDVISLFDRIQVEYPERNIVIKLDCSGLTDGIVSRLFEAERLTLISAMIIEWRYQWRHRHAREYIIDLLHKSGFQTFLFTPVHEHTGVLFAVQTNLQRSRSSQQRLDCIREKPYEYRSPV